MQLRRRSLGNTDFDQLNLFTILKILLVLVAQTTKKPLSRQKPNLKLFNIQIHRLMGSLAGGQSFVANPLLLDMERSSTTLIFKIKTITTKQKAGKLKNKGLN